jgi:hypothetical protein
MRQSLGIIGAAALVLTTADVAGAEELTRRRYTLPDGRFEITGEPARPTVVRIGMSRGTEGRPVYVAPHFYWGVTDRLTLGITHERGLCVSGRDDGCARVYDDVGFGLLLGLVQRRNIELDLHLRVPISSFDPFLLGARVGALARFNLSQLVALVVDPAAHFGLVGRDQPPATPDGVVIPVWVYFQPVRFIAPFVGAQTSGGFGDSIRQYVVAVEGGVVFEIAEDVDLGLVAGLPHVAGPGHDAGRRELGVLGRFRF